MSNKSSFIPLRPLLPATLILLAHCAAQVHAEDVIVTSCVGAGFNTCTPSCVADLGAGGLHTSASSAVPAGAPRSATVFATSTAATWAVTPSLSNSVGAYRVYVSQGTAYNCSTNIQVKLTAMSGCSLADTNFVPQTEIITTAFHTNASLNVWTPVAIITNHSKTPTILFSYVSGACSRWYMDEVRFESLTSTPATPARIIAILPGNPLTISGTGPVNHPFALLSSTNAAKPLNQWTTLQTDTAGTGTFSFSFSPGTTSARFFRVATQ